LRDIQNGGDGEEGASGISFTFLSGVGQRGKGARKLKSDKGDWSVIKKSEKRGGGGGGQGGVSPGNSKKDSRGPLLLKGGRVSQ